jgi:hypothetical protein
LTRLFVLISCLALLTGCTVVRLNVAQTETVLPSHRAWVDGRQVEYITTDTSDAAMAQSAGVNYVPRLRDAISARPSVLERVYKFSKDEQISIFQSAPSPVGAKNTDRSYSPLWRLVWVKQQSTGHMPELKSEEELLAAQEKGLVSLDVTDIVINCPVIKTVGGAGLRGVR